MNATQEHWDRIYHTKAPDAVSWYQPVPEPSLRALDDFNVPPTASLIDIGGGASSLVDHLLARGWSDLTVLDIAHSALALAKARLGDKSGEIRWKAADVTVWKPDRSWNVWHDRAVFHFLTEPEQRAAYRRALLAGTSPGSLVIVATFAPDGPEKCSGLAVKRYDAQALATELGTTCALQRAWREEHATPGGAFQAFQWGVFGRR
jgi:trans-aconitate methyltransferase